MDPDPVSVHSVAEAYLYLMVRPCDACGRGPLQPKNDLTKAGSGTWELSATCPVCATDETLYFRIQPEPTAAQARSNLINPTSEPSRSIDLLGWLTIFRSILGATSSETDKQEIRNLAIECAQCLDEALKFYDPDNELPPQSAFFSDASRRRFREHPQQFARSRWLHERSKLPSVVIQQGDDGPDKRAGWWSRLRRRSRD